MTIAQSSLWWRKPVINRHCWTWTDAHASVQRGKWWQHAVIYQIFPRTFKDSSGNGVGDIDGIIEKLPYIRSLGVEAIWLNPIYPSKDEDAGYDVTKLNDIDPNLGDLTAFTRLLKISHNMGIKVLLDQVWSHTADTHPWFQNSAESATSEKADWYVWADAAPDGSPPNNWLSAFTGQSAWIWHETRKQYYLANFMPCQPDLNWHNQAVIDAVLAHARFWLALGVDGFRIDAVNFFVHDKELRDNPARSDSDGEPDGVSLDNPLASQLLTHSFNREETLEKLSMIRELMDEFPDTVTLGEVTLCEDSIALSGAYVSGDNRLHLAYNSALLWDAPLDTEHLRDRLQRTQKHFPEGGQCWMVGNHDYERLRSRWTGKDERGTPYNDDFYKMVSALLIALPGALCLYQGDELGLPLANVPEDIPPEKLRDPFGKALFPKLPGRDGSRTPMPWDKTSKNCGFTEHDTPWLPIPRMHHDRSVQQQNKEPDSLLNNWRALLQWRVAQPALIAGDFETLPAHAHIFAFKRRYAEQTLYCLFNISGKQQTYMLDNAINIQQAQLFCINQEAITVQDNNITLEPYGAIFLSYITQEHYD